jgi:hypothetical protein
MFFGLRYLSNFMRIFFFNVPDFFSLSFFFEGFQSHIRTTAVTPRPPLLKSILKTRIKVETFQIKIQRESTLKI